MGIKQPVVAIVGRPNVGKSTFVNRVIGSREAIVDDIPGVTRDRSYYDAEWRGVPFRLIDTGGLIPDGDEPFDQLVNHQVELALTEADLVVFLVDGQAGITALDEDVTRLLRRAKKPVLLVVNKIDTADQRGLAAEFYGLGFGDPYPISAMHGDAGVGDLLDAIVDRLPEAAKVQADDDTIRITLLGRPNVGKSSILNAILGENRTIVSDIAGTTRDAIDVAFEYQGQPFVLIDTAGIRKKGKVDYGVEMFSVDRSLRALKKSDVAVMVLDATENLGVGGKSFITDQDKKILETVVAAGRGLVIVVNKWDLVPNKTTTTTEEFKKRLYAELPYVRFAPVVFTSAVSGQRLPKVLELTQTVAENCARRVKTSLMNEIILEAYQLSQPAPIKNKILKIYYATQASTNPPTFILFVNDAKLLKDSYRRYLEKKIRESFEFAGAPIVITPRNRGEKG